MNGISATILIILIVMVFVAPRRWAVLGMMAGVLYQTQFLSIEILGINIYPVRFLELSGFSRVLVRREFHFARLNGIDRAFLVLFSYCTVVYLVRTGKFEAYQIGVAVDAILCYFAFRGMISSGEDFRWFLSAFVIMLAPYLLLVSIESFTALNPFSIVGARSEVFLFREGTPRCVGSFRHPILMGALGASFLPLYVCNLFTMRYRNSAILGICLCIGIVLFANSGGPITAVGACMIGWSLWVLRKRMYLVRRCLVGILVLLAIFMKAPIWFIPEKISSITGGDGWHRSYLMDIAIQNIDKWLIAGMPITETADWLPYTIVISGGADITNQFISFGISAGLGAIILFILLLTLSFRAIGKSLEVVRSEKFAAEETEFLLWGLGVMLFVHIVNLIGVTYFDQFYVVWFMHLAAISTLSEIFLQTVRTRTSNDVVQLALCGDQ